MPGHALVVCRSFPHHRAGGMEWHAQDVVEGLEEAGWKVSVLTTPLPRRPALVPLCPSGTVIECGTRPGSYGPLFFPSLFGAAGRAVRRLGPDIIHAQGYAGPGCWYAFGDDFPVLTTIHGTLWSETALRDGAPGVRGLSRARLHWRYKHLHFLGPVWRRFLGSAAPLATDSQFTLGELHSDPAFRKNRPTFVVPLGFSLDRFPLIGREAARRRFGLGPEDVLLAAVGRLEAVKRPDLVLEGFLRVAGDFPSTRLLLAGEGALLAELRARAAASPFASRIELPGRLGADALPAMLEAADLFLNADHGAPAFGLANAEALCQGAPVLTTATGAHGEVVRERGDGRLVALGDRAAWESALRDLLCALPEDDSEREQRRDRARARFRRRTMIGELERAFAAVQAQGRSKAL